MSDLLQLNNVTVRYPGKHGQSDLVALDVIQPWPADTEPTAGTALFASEAEYEITITMFAEGKSYIHKLHVAESPFMGIFKCFPYCQYAG